MKRYFWLTLIFIVVAMGSCGKKQAETTPQPQPQPQQVDTTQVDTTAWQ